MRRIQYWVYKYLYAPVADLYYRIKDRNVRTPPVPCQICGVPGHKERYCPNAYRLGILAENEIDGMRYTTQPQDPASTSEHTGQD